MNEGNPARIVATKIAAFGLGEPWHDEVTPQLWWVLLPFLEVERLTGLAAETDGAGWLAIDEPQRAELREARVTATTRVLGLERFLLRFADAARDEGVDLVVLKGPSFAHRFYPDPSWRPFNDLDVLVRTKDWRRACAIVERFGFTRELPEPRPGFDERFGKAAAFFDEAGMCIDLHQRLVLGAFGVWQHSEELFERVVPFRVAGVTLNGLDDTATLLHACMHASLGWYPPLLLPLRDVAQIAASGSIDWERFAADAGRWRLGAVVRHSFASVDRILGIGLSAPALEAASRLRTTGRERRALATYVSGKRSRGGTLRSTFWAVPGLREKIALARTLALPDRTFWAARADEGDRPSYVRRLVTPLRWLLRRPV